MRPLLLLLLTLTLARAAEPPFEILPGDRVLLLGDTLLEREGTYGYLETRMHEQFADRPFTVRNLSWAGDTPLGLSRASFDPPAKGWERLREQIARVKPTVVFLGYGMAASLQQLTGQSQDPTLNADPVRYGTEPMTAARFKKDLGTLMDAISENAAPGAPGSTRVPRVGSGVPPERTSSDVAPDKRAPGSETVPEVRDGGTPSPTRETRVLPVRFVLLSPIRHEDLRATRPGLPDPAEHNKLLAEYAKAIEELAKERGARFVDLFHKGPHEVANDWLRSSGVARAPQRLVTDNGIHLTPWGYTFLAITLPEQIMSWEIKGETLNKIRTPAQREAEDQSNARREALRAAVIAKNELFFHQFRPANSTYLFGFRKHEQGKNAKEMAQFDPLIATAEAEIERLKRAPVGGSEKGVKDAPSSVPGSSPAPSAPIPRASGDHPKAALGSSQPPVAIIPGTAGDHHQRPPSSSPTPAVIITGTTGDHHQRPPSSSPTPAVIITGTAGDHPQIAHGTPSAPPGNTPPSAAPQPQPARSAPPLPTFTVADGYQIELWAENPLLEKPTEMNWDALGRLWVCSSSLYPQIEPGQPADDKILILSDPERTGKATKSEVFARGLLIPTGVVPDLAFGNEHLALGKDAAAPAGEKNPPREAPTPQMLNAKSSLLNAYACYVGQSTELLHIDATGRRRIVLSGFGTEDTHHIIHTLRWGPDGRLYFNQSIYIHSHLETPWGLVRVNSGAALAYDPRTERVEVFVKGFTNSWGHAWDRWGQSFFTDGAGGGGINWGFPGAQFVTYEGARQTVPSISPGSYPKFCGLELIYSPHFPADWQGNAVTCDFRAHRIVRFAITDLSDPIRDAGSAIRDKDDAATPHPASRISHPASVAPSSGYVTKEMPDLVRTSDLSFRPIDVKLGPDGALYVADWSNPIIQHGEVDFRDPRRDKHAGRIWRISKKDAPLVKWEALVGKKTPELLEGLLSGSLWEKEHASRTLIGRGGNPEPPEWGLQIVDVPSFSAELSSWSEKERGRASASWNIARGIGFDYHHAGTSGRMFQAHAVFELCSDADPRLRAIGIRNAGRWLTEPVYNYDSDCEGVGSKSVLQDDELPRLIADPNPRVRLEAMRALARIPTARSAELVLDAAVRSQALPRADGALPRESLSPATPPAGRAGALGSGERAGALGSDPDDVFYRHAAWLSINDLAQPWLAALASGEWNPEGRERQLEFALGALPPAAARGALAQVLGPGPRDFAKGPWAELIGRAGDPAQLRQLFDALLVSFGTHCCPGDELKLDATPIDDGTALRCVNALLEAARVRNQRPTGDLLPLERLVFHTNAALRTGVLRLVGYWKPAPGLDWLRGVFAENALDPACAAAAIESTRDLGGRPAIELLQKLAGPGTPAPTRQQAAVALAALDFIHLVGPVFDAISAAPSEDAALAAWRDLFKIKGAMEAVEKEFGDATSKLPPGTHVIAPGDDFTVADHRLKFPKTAATAALRAAREAGKKGEKLVARFAPLAGLTEAQAKMPKDTRWMVDFVKKDGDPARGELVYRRATGGCVTCHAIGGAGGLVGPSMTSLGASAPLDYIIESVFLPAAKVKEGYNAVTLALKDGTQATGIQVRETAEQIFLRSLTGQETAVVKANITGKTDIGTIMPAGLLDQYPERDRWDLLAFLGELGKPGPYDASKSNVARVWKLYPGTATDAALRGAPSDASANALTLVDGRLLRDQVKEALQLVTNPGDVIYAVTQFQSTGKTRLDLTGIAKAYLDGQPLTIIPGLAPELPAGLHTLTVKLDVPTLPEVLRATSADASFVTN